MKAPVLLIVFNRPDTTAEVLQAIREYEPDQLFVAQDGPRAIAGEAERCAEVRRIVGAVDWDCDVRYLIREENLGCGRGVSEAITWFFDHVEAGVILEDDCVPVPDFFRYCEELLDRYASDERVWMISGANLLGSFPAGGASYFFADGGVWGWATWRRAWRHMSLRPPEWNDPMRRARARELLGDRLWAVVASELERVFAGDLDTWDYQWLFIRASHGCVGSVPVVNLVQNIGFGADATHTVETDSPFARIRTHSLPDPIRHPSQVVVNRRYLARLMRDRRRREQREGVRRRVSSLAGLARTGRFLTEPARSHDDAGA